MYYILFFIFIIYSFSVNNCAAQRLRTSQCVDGDFNNYQIFDSTKFHEINKLKIEPINNIFGVYLDCRKWKFENNFNNIKIINEDSIKRQNSVKLGNMGLECLVGTGMGLGGVILGALIGSFGHIVGDTSSSHSDDVVRVQIVLMCIGHAIGSLAGVGMEAEKLDGQGSLPAAWIGGALGETISLYVLLKNKNAFTGVIYLVCSSILGTIGYNLFRNSRDENNFKSSLINYKKGKLYFGSPGIYFTNNKINKIRTNLNLLDVNF